jgi:hypothetical protein
MDTVNKDKNHNKIRFLIGVLVGIVMVSILFIPEISPIIDNPRFFQVNPYLYLVTAVIIVGFILGNGIKNGAKAGFLGGTMTLILLIFKRLIFDLTYVYFESSKLIQVLASLFGLIIMLAVPMAIGGAIGGLVREIMKTASER